MTEAISYVASPQAVAEAKAAKAALRLAPEAIAAMILSAIWPLTYVVAGPSIALLLFVLVLCACAVGATVIVINTGSQGLLVFSAGFVAVLSLAAMAVLDFGPLGIVASSSSTIVYLDLMRLNFARRRTDHLDENLVMRTLVASLIVVGLSAASIVGALTIAGDGEAEARSWIWVPAATAVVVVPGLVLVIASSRKSGQHDKRRWTPGERMLPQPNID